MRFPLFPLRAALFPGATLALHVFEPRYREMIGRCLEHEEPFGVCLILEGEEIGGPATPHRVGTEAEIIASQRYPDGRYDIVAEGRRRFEILTLDRTRPVLRAEVRFLDEPEGALADGLAEGIATLLQSPLQPFDLLGRGAPEGSWKELDPCSLSYKIASALPLSEEAKQDLLAIPDTATRLRRIADALMALRRIGAAADAG